ncbi:MAG: hypothetical protein ACLSDQ_13110 [Adlercreutzia equolifaciens]
MTWECSNRCANASPRSLPTLGTCAGLILWPTISAPCPSPCAAAPTAASSAASTPRSLEEGAKGQKKPGQPASQTRRLLEQQRLASAVPLTFIRAPRIEATGPGVEPLVTLNDAPVAVRYRNQIAAAFHPELDDDHRLYEALLAPLKRAY